MKKQLKTAFAAALALMMALALVPFSALTRSEAKAEAEPTWTVPEGYNEHDYNKIVAFLEQTDENGVKNGVKFSETYDPNDPGTWGKDFGDDCVAWNAVNSEQRLKEVRVVAIGCVGILDLSGCASLEKVYALSSINGLDVSGCFGLTYLLLNGYTKDVKLDLSDCIALKTLDYYCSYLTELDLSNCTALENLTCRSILTKLDLSHNTALVKLKCTENNLTELDLSHNTMLRELDCSNNMLTKLDLSKNPALETLQCFGNNLSELDLSNNPELGYDRIMVEGNGRIGYSLSSILSSGSITAYPMNGASFEGFYDESGGFVSSGERDDVFNTNTYRFTDIPTGTIIARFSGGTASNDTPANPGDTNANPGNTNAATNEKPAKSGSTLVIVLAIVAAVAVIGAIGFIMMKKKRVK